MIIVHSQSRFFDANCDFWARRNRLFPPFTRFRESHRHDLYWSVYCWARRTWSLQSQYQWLQFVTISDSEAIETILAEIGHHITVFSSARNCRSNASGPARLVFVSCGQNCWRRACFIGLYYIYLVQKMPPVPLAGPGPLRCPSTALVLPCQEKKPGRTTSRLAMLNCSRNVAIVRYILLGAISPA